MVSTSMLMALNTGEPGSTARCMVRATSPGLKEPATQANTCKVSNMVSVCIRGLMGANSLGSGTQIRLTAMESCIGAMGGVT